jgi:hypothetical protein
MMCRFAISGIVKERTRHSNRDYGLWVTSGR